MEKTWRMSKDDFLKKKKAFDKEEHDLRKEWSEWGLKPQSVEDIIFRALLDRMFGNDEQDYICHAYVIETTQLPADAIKDLLFITSQAFSFDYWCDEVVDFVCEILEKQPYNSLNDLRNVADGNTDLPKEFVSWCREAVLDAYKYSYRAYFNLINSISKVGASFAKDAQELGYADKIMRFETDLIAVRHAQKRFDDAKERLGYIRQEVTNVLDKIERFTFEEIVDGTRINLTDRIVYADIADYQNDCPEYLKKYKRSRIVEGSHYENDL